MRCGWGAWHGVLVWHGVLAWRGEAWVGRMVRRSRVARRGVGRVVRLHLISAARTWEVGGNCSIRRPTRRRHAVTGLLMLPNPHSARCVGGIRCPEGYARHQWVRQTGFVSPFVIGLSRGKNWVPRAVAGLPGQRGCPACDCTDANANVSVCGGKPRGRRRATESDGEHNLRGATLVHGCVALGGPLER